MGREVSDSDTDNDKDKSLKFKKSTPKVSQEIDLTGRVQTNPRPVFSPPPRSTISVSKSSHLPLVSPVVTSCVSALPLGKQSVVGGASSLPGTVRSTSASATSSSSGSDIRTVIPRLDMPSTRSALLPPLIPLGSTSVTDAPVDPRPAQPKRRKVTWTTTRWTEHGKDYEKVEMLEETYE